MATDATPSWLQPAPPSSAPAAGPGPWALFERFLTDVEGGAGAERQAGHLLAAVLGLSHAEAAAVVPLAYGEPVTVAGPARLDPEAARAIVSRLLDHAPPTDSQHAAAAYGPATLPAIFRGRPGPVPSGAALVRVSRARAAWVLAVTLTPGRQLAPGSLGAMRLAARVLRTQQKAARYAADLGAALLGVVQGFAAATDAKDPYTYGHSERVARMGSLVGRGMGLPEGTVNDLYLSGLLHDVGKIGVPEAVLSKPGALNDDEFALVKAHPVIGDRILLGIRQLDHVRPGVRSHHERWDGRGYPDKLAGEAIPLLGRVLAVADTCDAMLSARPYRPAMEPRRVEAELIKGRGLQWDPRAVDGFLACRREVYATRDGGLGASVYAAVNNAVEVAASMPAPRR